ncbi:unnamed protein product, partial [Candidula unifasciata]
MAEGPQPYLEDMNGIASGDHESCFDDVEMAATGINMLLNNGFQEAFALFDKYKNESPLMHSGYSFVFFMQALMSYEEEKLGEAQRVLQETEKHCSTQDGFVKSFRRKFSKKKNVKAALRIEERITNQVIVADCLLYQAVLVFTNQDISSYVKGGWLLRKAWKIYERLHKEVTSLMDSLVQGKVSRISKSFSSSVDPEPADAMAEISGIDHAAVNGVIDDCGEGLSADVLTRLLGAVNFGYGTFQLCLSMVPPRILKLIEFLGFEGDREVGLSCLAFTSHTKDMKAPLATLALLWYHTVLRPFFALDGANHFQA